MADDIPNIREADLCRIVRIPRSTRTSWVKSGVILQPNDGRFGERHVVEAMIFLKLTASMESRLAQAVWIEAKDRVLSSAMDGSLDELERFDVLVNVSSATLAIVSDASEIGEILTRDAGEPYLLLRLASDVSKVRRAYRRFARVDGAAGSSRAPRRRGKRSAGDSSTRL